MSIEFGHKMNDGISVNPSRTIGSIIPQITNMKSGTGIGFGRNSGDGIPPRNIVSFSLFDRGAHNFSNRSALWNVTYKVIVKPLEKTESSKTLSARIILKLITLGAKNL